MNRLNSTFKAIGISALLALSLAACGSAATTTTSTAATTAAAASIASSASTASVPSAAASVAAGSTAAASTAAASTAAATTAKLNLNTVTSEQLLATIPNFPTRMVREFEEYRPYVSIQEFRKEIGKYVSADQVTAWEQYVYVPIDVDAADAATLEQLPGVDATIAEAIIAARPYSTADAFLAKLGTLIPHDQLAAAQAYLAQ